jgi:hypothetical protein
MGLKLSLKPFPSLIPYSCANLVRLGNRRDGGYVVDSVTVRNATHLISFGLGSNITFEEDFLAQNKSVEIYCCDHTVSKTSLLRFLRLIAISAICRNSSLFRDYFRVYRTSMARRFHHIQKKVVPFSTNSKEISLADLINAIDSEKVFLKVDIEGDEYGILEQIIQFKAKLIGLIIEFHDTEKKNSLIDNFVKSIEEDLMLIHFHANNFSRLNEIGLPDAIELSFANRNFSHSAGRITTLPNAILDAPNAPNRVDYEIDM